MWWLIRTSPLIQPLPMYNSFPPTWTTSRATGSKACCFVLKRSSRSSKRRQRTIDPKFGDAAKSPMLHDFSSSVLRLGYSCFFQFTLVCPRQTGSRRNRYVAAFSNCSKEGSNAYRRDVCSWKWCARTKHDECLKQCFERRVKHASTQDANGDKRYLQQERWNMLQRRFTNR